MRLLLTFVVCLTQVVAFAQTQHTQAFPITDYMVPSGDSIMIVQVELPENIHIKENTVGLLQPKWTAEDTSTTSLGYGRCYLIKGNYYYFGIRLKARLRKPKAGDLIYTQAVFPSLYTGLLQSIYSHHISLLNAYGNPIFSTDSLWHHSSAAREQVWMNQLVEEIQFVGKMMKEQGDQQDQVIKEGPYAGKRLFDFMVIETNSHELKKFLKYIEARPVKYAGNAWSISEIYATWLVSGAPMVVENGN